MPNFLFMKKLFLTLAILPIVLLSGCSFFESGEPEVPLQRIEITTTNHWEFLNITIVASRLQIFPEINYATYENVIVTYEINNGELRVLNLSTSGRGESQTCTFAFPRIVSVTGWVTFGV